jgi:hypothetical protein
MIQAIKDTARIEMYKGKLGSFLPTMDKITEVQLAEKGRNIQTC